MSWDEASASDWMADLKMLGGETLTGLLETYAQVTHRTRNSWRSGATSTLPGNTSRFRKTARGHRVLTVSSGGRQKSTG